MNKILAVVMISAICGCGLSGCLLAAAGAGAGAGYVAADEKDSHHDDKAKTHTTQPDDANDK